MQTLSAPGYNALDPDIAVDNSGDAVVTWQRFDGKDWRAQAIARSAAGVLSPMQNLSLAGQDAFSPQVSVDDDGDAVFIWYRSDGLNDRVQGRARSAAGVLSGVQNISGAGQDAYPGGLAVDSIGRAVFTWRRFDGANWRVQARARTAAGVLSAVQDLSAAGKDALEPHVGVSDKGNAVFTWRRFDSRGESRVQTRARSSPAPSASCRTCPRRARTDCNPQSQSTRRLAVPSLRGSARSGSRPGPTPPREL